jgi:hypothetical protein
MFATQDTTKDTNGNEAQFSIEDDSNVVKITGNYITAAGVATPFTNLPGGTTLPAADPALTTYVSFQVTSAGALSMFSSTSGAVPLQGGEFLEVYRTTIAPNQAASADETADMAITPDLQ